MKRDILFLCQFFYPEYVSSATLPFDTALALARAGYTVDALCGYPREYADGQMPPRRETHEGIRIRRLSYLQLKRTGAVGRIINYLSFTASALLHISSLRQYRAVVVYSNPPLLPWVAALAKRWFGCKLIFVAYDLYPEIALRTGAAREGGLMARVMEHINRRVYPCADRVVALSSEMRTFIAAHRPIPPERICVIPNWYQDEGPRQELSPDNRFYDALHGRFVVGYFGNLGTAQDLDTLLDAIRLLKNDPSVHFLFAGHGNKLPRLREAVEQEGLDNVTVCGFLHGKDFQDALEIAGCAVVSLAPGLTGVCVPSKTYSYMMKGIPLLVLMGPSDIAADAENGAGFRVDNGDSAALAGAIRRLRDDPVLCARMRQTCRALYEEKYTTERSTARYVELFHSLLPIDFSERGHSQP